MTPQNPTADDRHWDEQHAAPSERWNRGEAFHAVASVLLSVLIVLTIGVAKFQNDRLRTIVKSEAETVAKVESVISRIDQEVASLAVDRRQDVERIMETPSVNYDAIMENRRLQEAIARKIGLSQTEIDAALKGMGKP